MNNKKLDEYIGLRRSNAFVTFFPIFSSLIPIIISFATSGTTSFMFFSLGIVVLVLGLINLEIVRSNDLTKFRLGFTAKDLDYVQKNFWKVPE